MGVIKEYFMVSFFTFVDKINPNERQFFLSGNRSWHLRELKRKTGPTARIMMVYLREDEYQQPVLRLE